MMANPDISPGATKVLDQRIGSFAVSLQLGGSVMLLPFFSARL